MKSINWKQLKQVAEEWDFSGVVHATQSGEEQSASYGFANRGTGTKNQENTKFAIASGAKIFTAVGICQLVWEGKLSFNTKLTDVLDISFPHFSEGVTIHHLLTHTSGVPDYFDEDVMEDFELLWENVPMYHMRKPSDFLPLFCDQEMVDEVGCDFHYNNAGYILLGLVIEQVSGNAFADYIEKHIMQLIGMTDSGYYEMDRLPKDTALGYIDLPDGTWKTNIFSVPAKGGPDGGVYVTAKDMGIFWNALFNHTLLTKDMTDMLLKPRTLVTEDIYYGYCGYMEVNEKGVVKLIQLGYDPGINYRALYYPRTDLLIVVCANIEEGAYEMLKEIESMLV
ncbi:MAG TPA: serine hydrolase [Bacillota bacterium]|nr:serine hydrolase [Bacillota bacterium]